MRSFEQLDDLNFINEHGQMVQFLEIERTEQLQARQYVPINATVLELGARYGTVSCSIAYKLDDDRRLVVVEPDINVLSALEANKKTAGCNFHIFNGIISNKDMILKEITEHNGYANFVTDVQQSEKDVYLKRKTIDEIENEYGLKFDCLVADCEGFMEQFCDENQDRLREFNVIIYEADAPHRCNYDRVNQYLNQWGFKCIVNGMHLVFIK
jgi:FkbM family methyltransferase